MAYSLAPGVVMTSKQKQIFEYIERYLENEGLAPSFNEIRIAMGLNSLSTVAKHLDALESQGRIRRVASSRNYTGQRVRSIAVCKGIIPSHVLIAHVGCDGGYAVGEASEPKCSACGKPVELIARLKIA